MAEKSSDKSPSDSVTTTATVTITSEKDVSVPNPPSRFILVLKMGWQQMKDFYGNFSNSELMNAIKSERKIISQKLQSGKDINQREIEIINKSTKEKLRKRFGDFQTALYNALELKEGDDQKVKLVKIQLAKEIMQWLENLESWLVKKLSVIFDNNEIPEDKILEETEKFVRELNSVMKPPAVEELVKKMEATPPSEESTPDTNKDGSLKSAKRIY